MRRIKGRIQSYVHRGFRHIVPLRWFRVGKDKPRVMILLLRQPHVFSEEEIRSAAERAWGIAFWGTHGSTRRILVSDDMRVFLQAGPHQLSICSTAQPYTKSPETDVDWLPSLNQQKAWAGHKACCWIYYLTETTDLELADCVIARIAV